MRFAGEQQPLIDEQLASFGDLYGGVRQRLAQERPAQGPHTPLPVPGWNPSMIKAPGNPNFRPAPLWEAPSPVPGKTTSWGAGLQANGVVPFQRSLVLV